MSSAASPLPRTAPDDPGRVIGNKYRLLRKLDEGGMGAVWVAENIDLDAQVAVKLLRGDRPRYSAERLRQEAKVLAQLEHPAILRVLDSGCTEAGKPYLVTELLTGETLAHTLWQRRLSPTRAVQIVLPVLEGLSVAHARGIVHRDLKPANIFLARLANGRLQPKVLDFGIASAFGGTERTADGAIFGSPVYMSPEQARGLPVDARTDVWSISVVLYEMVVGYPPFDGGDHQAVLLDVVHGEPTSLPEHGLQDLGLWAIIRRGLAKDPRLRFRDAGEFGVSLAQWLVDRDVQDDAASNAVHATWLAPTSARTVSSYPPMVLDPEGTQTRAVESTTPLPAVTESEQRISQAEPLESGGWRRSPRPLWLAVGVAAGAIGAWLYARDLRQSAETAAPTWAVAQPTPPSTPAGSSQVGEPAASASSHPRAGSTSAPVR